MKRELVLTGVGHDTLTFPVAFALANLPALVVLGAALFSGNTALLWLAVPIVLVAFAAAAILSSEPRRVVVRPDGVTLGRFEKRRVAPFEAIRDVAVVVRETFAAQAALVLLLDTGTVTVCTVPMRLEAERGELKWLAGEIRHRAWTTEPVDRGTGQDIPEALRKLRQPE